IPLIDSASIIRPRTTVSDTIIQRLTSAAYEIESTVLSQKQIALKISNHASEINLDHRRFPVWSELRQHPQPHYVRRTISSGNNAPGIEHSLGAEEHGVFPAVPQPGDDSPFALRAIASQPGALDDIHAATYARYHS